MQHLGIYLVMKGNCEEAFNYYQSIFGGELSFARYKDAPQNQHNPKTDGEKIMNVTFKTATFELMGCDMPDYMEHPANNNNFNIILNVDSKLKADQYFNSLIAAGQILMPIVDTFWGAYFGMVKDKFGIQWMVSFSI
jgi:PhnB protein